MSQPIFNKIITGNGPIDRIQANMEAAFNSISGLNAVTAVTTRRYGVEPTDSILTFNTQAIAGVTGSIALIIIMPDATQCNGFSFAWKKLDTSSNPVNFITYAKNNQGIRQTLEAAASPYSTTASLASGTWFSDGQNWWLIT